MAQPGLSGASAGTPRWLLNGVGVLIMLVWAAIMVADLATAYEASPMSWGLPAIAGPFFGVSLVKK